MDSDTYVSGSSYTFLGTVCLLIFVAKPELSNLLQYFEGTRSKQSRRAFLMKNKQHHTTQQMGVSGIAYQ